MIDQESLFGLPDFERFPMLKQRTRKVGIETVDRDRYNAYMDSYFYHPMEVGRLNATDEPSTDVRRLHLYTLADLAVSMRVGAADAVRAHLLGALGGVGGGCARDRHLQICRRTESLLRNDFPPCRFASPPGSRRSPASRGSTMCTRGRSSRRRALTPRARTTLWGSVYGISNVEEASAARLAATALFFIVLVDVLRGIFMLTAIAVAGWKTSLLNLLGAGALQLLMLGLAIGLLAHVSSLFTRHAANLVFVLQTQDDPYFFSAMHDLKLGTRVASSGLMLYSNAFAVTVAAGASRCSGRCLRDGKTQTKNGEEINNLGQMQELVHSGEPRRVGGPRRLLFAVHAAD